MKRIITLLCICAVLCTAVSLAPSLYEQSVPVAATISAEVKAYSEYASGSGRLAYIGQTDLTCALPLVIDSYTVKEGDTVSSGDVIATIDRQATATLFEGYAKLPQLAVAAADMSTAVSLIPDSITSDRDGRIVALAGNGATVQSGGSIATIAGESKLVLTAAVSEQQLADIYEGQRVYFSCAAYPEEQFSGEVVHIAQAARSQYSGSVLETVVDVTVLPDEQDSRLKSGLTADARFVISEGRHICVLPYSAIGQDDSGEYVYVYSEGKALRRRIATGAEFSDGAEIVCGISPEDKVIVSPENVSDSGFVRVEG